MTALKVSTRGAVAGLATVSVVLAGCSSIGGGSGSDGDGGTELSVYIDSAPSSIELWDGIIAAWEEVDSDIAVSYETHPPGSEGDNLIKTRLATGEMNDLFWYNSGSLFEALDPDANLVDLSDEPWVDSLLDDFRTVVSTDSGLYGAPVGASFAGAVIYNKDVYAELGLEVPTTWEEFLANSQAAADAGKTGIVQTYGDTWTSQLFVLADFYNVLAQEPDWAERYTAGDAKYVDPPALGGFENLQEAYESGTYNEDFASATYDDGVRMLAEGEGVHYPMLTGNVAPAVGANHPDAAESLGVFPLPGRYGGDSGLTVWMPAGTYIPDSTEGEQLEAAKEFLAWLVTPESCEVQAESSTLGGPFVVEGCSLPEDALPMVQDMQSYFDEGQTGLALEFLSPIKGPALEQITVEVGSGIRPAADGAALYDEDVRKQAQQLGLEGW